MQNFRVVYLLFAQILVQESYSVIGSGDVSWSHKSGTVVSETDKVVDSALVIISVLSKSFFSLTVFHLRQNYHYWH